MKPTMNLAYGVLIVSFLMVLYRQAFTARPSTSRQRWLSSAMQPLLWPEVWNPVPPLTQVRVTALLMAGHRFPHWSKHLLSRTDRVVLRQTVTFWNHDQPSDVMTEHLYWLLKDSHTEWVVIERLVRTMVRTPELLLELANTELGIPSPGAAPDGIAYAVSQAQALHLRALTDLSAGMGLLISNFSTSNAKDDPLKLLWPDEDRAEVNHVLYFTRQLSPQDATFGEIIDNLTRCVPTTQPGWVGLVLPYLRTLSLTQAVRFPEDGVEQLWNCTELFRQRADCITAAAALKRAGAPGEFEQLVELVDAIDL